jgi:hypothetical protein
MPAEPPSADRQAAAVTTATAASIEEGRIANSGLAGTPSASGPPR